MEKIAKTKLADKNISWEESYTDATERFKLMYEDIVGPGSYFRWEGHDLDSGDDYFVIVGPAKMKDPVAKWFAGSRKLPSDWAAGGKYFSEIKEAINYANETWGVPIPSDVSWKYDASDLKGIASKMDKWREEHKGEFVKESKGVNNMLKINEDFNIIIQEAMGDVPHTKREGYMWWDLNTISSSPSFIEEKKIWPNLEAAYMKLIQEDRKRRGQIVELYGPEHANAGFYKVWLAHKGDYGTHLISVSPYLGKAYLNEEQAMDKFSFFRKKLTLTLDGPLSQEAVDEKIGELIQRWERDYGLTLSKNDFEIRGLDKLEPVITPKKEWIDEFHKSPVYLERLAYYNAKNHSQAKKEYNRRKKLYDMAVKDGTALEQNIPPPPRIDVIVYKVGQQQFEKISTRAKDADEAVSQSDTPIAEEKEFGFDSLYDAIVAGAQNMPYGGFPAPDASMIPQTTSEDLRKARKEYEERKKTIQVPEKKIRTKTPKNTPKPKTEDVFDPEANKTPNVSTSPDPDFVDPNDVLGPENEDDWITKVKSSSDEKRVLSETIMNLVKLSETLDREGKCEEAEEVHRILKKHIGLKGQ